MNELQRKTIFMKQKTIDDYSAQIRSKDKEISELKKKVKEAKSQMHSIKDEIKNEKALNLLAKQNEHEANKTLFTIQEILNDTDWSRVKSKNVLKKFESVWNQLEDVRLGYAYKRR